MSISNLKGVIGEQAFALEAAKRGFWTGQMPQDCPYDFVMDCRDGNLKRVQVKYKKLKANGSFTIKLRVPGFTNRADYCPETIDYMAVYVPDIERVFLIDINDIHDVDEVSIRVIESKNGQSKGVRLAENLDCWKKNILEV